METFLRLNGIKIQSSPQDTWLFIDRLYQQQQFKDALLLDWLKDYTVALTPAL